jgi:hypothetical protein
MKRGQRDFSGMGIFEDAYSYDRPSWVALNAIMNALMDNGFTKEQAFNWVHSKSYRWFLDGNDYKISDFIYKLISKSIEDTSPSEYDDEIDSFTQNQLNKCEEEEV